MRSIKSIFALILVAAFIIAGCAREPYVPPTIDTNVKGTCTPTPTDPDGDCIPNALDNPDNPTTKEIACHAPDGATYYLDCSTTPDCNCNYILDSEEIELVEDCGWGCVAGNARTYAMIAGALVLGYGGYAAIAGEWPFGRDKAPDNDVTGANIEYISLAGGMDSINYQESYIRFLKDEAAIQVYIDGNCKSDDDASLFYCKLEYQYGIDHIVIPPNNSNAADPYTDNLNYSYDLEKSILKKKSLHYVKVTDTRKGEDYFLKDPKWIGLPIKDTDGSMTIGYKLSDKDSYSGAVYFDKLEFGFGDARSCYQIHRGASYLGQNRELFSNTNPIFYFWQRYTCQ